MNRVKIEICTVFLFERSVGIENKIFVTFGQNQLMELTMIMKHMIGHFLSDFTIERKLN